jgi:hypothetical protein
MGTRESRNDRELEREIERYREAANVALEQLEWAIDYLYGIRKVEIARALARNRKQILERMR